MVDVPGETIPGFPECLELEVPKESLSASPEDGNDEKPQEVCAPITPISLPSSYASGSSVCCLNLNLFCIMLLDLIYGQMRYFDK